jgi:FAD synthase
MTSVNPPIVISGLVQKGFGRGGKQLGTPTANLDPSALKGDETLGVYMGWARLQGHVYKCVASIGWNPFFKNEKIAVEPHIMHKFTSDFYGEELAICLCGYLRPERDFVSLEALKQAIADDIAQAEVLLDQEPFKQFASGFANSHV